MRNLKRALSLGLASSMVLGTMAFSASAATSTSVTPTEVKTSFNDNDSIAPENVNSIYIAEQIGLTTGKDGNIFDPDSTVTRMEMAVICVNMKFGVDYANANFSEGDAANPQFSDLTWGYEFAKVAAQEGIIYGVGEDANGNMMFNPDGKVIAADALLMIMKTLGYFKNPAQEFAVDYKYAAGARATELSLYNEKEYALVEELTREEVYAVAVRALTTCARVDYNYETGNYYNESAGYNSAMLPNNNIVEDTLGYQKFDLKAVDSVDSFNRPTTLWTVGGQRISNFVEDVHTDSNGAAMEYTTAKTYQDIAKELTAYTKTSNEDYYEYGIYVDGMEYSEWMDALGHTAAGEKLAATTTLEGFNAVMDSQNTGHFKPSDNGVLTQVFVTDKVEYFNTQGEWVVEQGKVFVTCINTYLAEVDTSVDHETGEHTTRVSYFENIMNDSNGAPIGLSLDVKHLEFSVSTYEGFEEDGIVMIQASAQGLKSAGNGQGFNNQMEVIHIDEPTTVEGQVTNTKLSQNYVGGSWMVIDDDVSYNYSVGMRGELNTDDAVPGAGDNVIAYLDGNVDENGNGYVLGYSLVEEAPRYLYVEENYDWTYYNGLAALVTFADGTEEVINITKIDGDTITSDTKNIIPGTGRFKTEDGTIISANENYKTNYEADADIPGYYVEDTTNYELENRIFGYTELADGTYNVTTTIQKDYDADDGAKKGGLLEMVKVNNIVNDSGAIVEAEEDVNQGSTAHGTLSKSVGNLDGVPVKDTMAIFSSAYMPEGGSVDVTYANPANEVLNINENDSLNVDGNDDYYAFAFRKNYSNAYSLQTSIFGATGEVTDPDGWNFDGFHDTAFAVGDDTLFVDVVNNKSWVGYRNDDNELNEYDLNMQVVFGNDGIASVVYINNGADPVTEDGYFILLDTKPEDYLDAEGNVIYKYWVYIDGELTFFESKGKEIEVTNDNQFFEGTEKLQTNTLYFISEKDTDGYVREVDFRYDYTPITNTVYDKEAFDAVDVNILTGTFKDNGLAGINTVYNNHWSVASIASAGHLELRHDDQFANATGLVDVGMFDDDAIAGEDTYSYNDSTVFVVLQANKNGDIFDVRPGSASDIKTYKEGSNAISWVDVVQASSSTENKRTPYAELVVILQAWPLDTPAVTGSFKEVKLTGGAGIQTNPFKLEAIYNGSLNLTEDEMTILREEAFINYLDDIQGSQPYSYNKVANLSGDTYTTWRVERVLTTGVVVEEYYRVHNDDIVENDDDVLDPTPNVSLDDFQVALNGVNGLGTNDSPYTIYGSLTLGGKELPAGTTTMDILKYVIAEGVEEKLGQITYELNLISQGLDHDDSSEADGEGWKFAVTYTQSGSELTKYFYVDFTDTEFDSTRTDESYISGIVGEGAIAVDTLAKASQFLIGDATDALVDETVLEAFLGEDLSAYAGEITYATTFGDFLGTIDQTDSFGVFDSTSEGSETIDGGEYVLISASGASTAAVEEDDDLAPLYYIEDLSEMGDKTAALMKVTNFMKLTFADLQDYKVDFALTEVAANSFETLLRSTLGLEYSVEADGAPLTTVQDYVPGSSVKYIVPTTTTKLSVIIDATSGIQNTSGNDATLTFAGASSVTATNLSTAASGSAGNFEIIDKVFTHTKDSANVSQYFGTITVNYDFTTTLAPTAVNSASGFAKVQQQFNLNGTDNTEMGIYETVYDVLLANQSTLTANTYVVVQAAEATTPTTYKVGSATELSALQSTLRAVNLERGMKIFTSQVAITLPADVADPTSASNTPGSTWTTDGDTTNFSGGITNAAGGTYYIHASKKVKVVMTDGVSTGWFTITADTNDLLSFYVAGTSATPTAADLKAVNVGSGVGLLAAGQITAGTGTTSGIDYPIGAYKLAATGSANSATSGEFTFAASGGLGYDQYYSFAFTDARDSLIGGSQP